MMQDIRFAARMARKNPGTTVAVFLALSIGIGGSVAIFSVVNTVMLRPLSVKEDARLVEIFSTDSRSDRDDVSMADYLDWKHDLRSVSGLALYRTSQATLQRAPSPERVVTIQAEWSLLPVLGVAPAQGRNFFPDENKPGNNHKAILSWPFWQSRFGGRNVLGELLELDDGSYTIVGVLPANFTLLGHRDLLLPLSFDSQAQENKRGYHAYNVLGRLAPGFDLLQANAELASVSASLAAAFPTENKGVVARAVGLRAALSGEGVGGSQKNVRAALVLLLVAVLCVLLIACVNVANINLVRSLSRQREIALRLAVGASRLRLFRQTFIESLLLSLVSAAAGVALAAALIRVFARLPLTVIPRLQELSIDWRVLAFALALGVFTGLASGLMPALRSSNVNLNEVLKQANGRITASRGQLRARQLFITFEAGLAAILLIECSLFIQSFARVSEIKMDFTPDHVLTLYLSLPTSRYGPRAPGSVLPLARNVLSRIRALPGVLASAVTSDLPLTGTAPGAGVLLEGQTRPRQFWDGPYVVSTDISPQYFNTFQIPLFAGTDFSDRNLTAKVAIVNQTFVRRFFPHQNPIGKRVALLTANPDWRQIVGVVGDVPQKSIEEHVEPQLFLPLTNSNVPWLALVLRTAGDPGPLLSSIRAELAKIDSAVAIFLPRSMRQILWLHLFWRSLQTWLVAAFTALALALVSLGIYATTAYSVNLRTSEMGLRMALGASNAQLYRLIVWQGVKPALIGAAGGIVCGAVVASLTSNLLFGTDPRSIIPYLAALSVTIVAATAASYGPAKRAAKTEPLEALRHE